MCDLASLNDCIRLHVINPFSHRSSGNYGFDKWMNAADVEKRWLSRMEM